MSAVDGRPPGKKKTPKKGSTSRHCYVKDCGNGDYRLQKWKTATCEEHAVSHDSDSCTCKPPFELFNFPTKSAREMPNRQIWLRNLQRAEEAHSTKLLEPSKDHRLVP